MCPLMTLASHMPWSGTGSCRRRSSPALSLASFAVSRFLPVIRRTQNCPRLLIAQMCVNPRKLNVSGFPAPRAFRLGMANRPNSISRVLPGCSSRLNFANLSRSAVRNRSASAWYWNPATKSSAKRTMITSPRASWFRHHTAHRSRTWCRYTLASNGETGAPYAQCRVMRSAGLPGLVRAGSVSERCAYFPGGSEAGEPVEETGVLVPFGQVAGDGALVGGFEGFAFRLGRGSGVDLGGRQLDITEDVADVGQRHAKKPQASSTHAIARSSENSCDPRAAKYRCRRRQQPRYQTIVESL